MRIPRIPHQQIERNMSPQLANSPHQMVLLLLFLSCMASEGHGVQDGGKAASSVIRVDCRLYRQEEGPVQPVVLDCRPDVTASYVQRGFVFRRQAMLLMPPTTGQRDARRRRPVWTLDKTTLVTSGDTDVNILPREAFANLAETVTTGHVLSLRRLRQRRLDLSALARLPQLRHLEVAETNATCLTRDMFESAPRLVSLRLVDNRLLSCMQPDTLAGLDDLAELSILGSPRLKSLNAAAAAPSLIDLQLADIQQSWNGALCRASGLRRLRLDQLPQQPLLLAGLTGLQSLRVDAHDDMLLVVLKLAPAACALWPDGRLQLNGISLANWTLAQVLQDFSQFCEFQQEIDSFDEQARLLCDSAPHHVSGNCFAECNSDVKSFEAQTLASTVTTSPAENDDSDPSASATITGANVVIKSYGGWNVDQRGVLGTALLTAGAFLGGVLVAAYCCSSSRLGGGLKPSATGSVASSSGGGSCGSGGVPTIFISGGSDHLALEEDEPIRLIGYSVKSTASLPALEGPLVWTD